MGLQKGLDLCWIATDQVWRHEGTRYFRKEMRFELLDLARRSIQETQLRLQLLQHLQIPLSEWLQAPAEDSIDLFRVEGGDRRLSQPQKRRLVETCLQRGEAPLGGREAVDLFSG